MMLALPETGSPSLQRRVALHALNRLGFGPRPGDIGRVLGRGVERYVLEQLEPAPDAELAARLAPFSSLNYSITQALAAGANWRNHIDELYTSKIVRAVHSQNQ